MTSLDCLVWDILQELVYEGKRELFANLKDLQNGIGDMACCQHQTARIRKAMLWWKKCLAAMAKQNFVCILANTEMF